MALVSSPGVDGRWLLGAHPLIRPLIGLDFHSAGCPHTLLTQVNPDGRASLVANNSTMRQVVLVCKIPVTDRVRPEDARRARISKRCAK